MDMMRRRLGLGFSALALSFTWSLSAQAADGGRLPHVRIRTSLGMIVVEVDTRRAPVTAANFLQYVKDGFYDGTVFHRVIDGFMIQGGGYTPDFKQKPTRPPIRLETHPELHNRRGTLAMARTADPNSATAQFFINVVDNTNLDAPRPDGYGYAVFGRVIFGMDVVDRIKSVRTTNSGPYQNVPVKPVFIEKATQEN